MEILLTVAKSGEKNMNKVAYNSDYGGFGLSKKACELAASKGHKGAIEHLKRDFGRSYMPWDESIGSGFRHDPIVISVIEELGTEEAAADFACLTILEIHGHQYKIDDYDGFESVNTPHNICWVNIEKETT